MSDAVAQAEVCKAEGPSPRWYNWYRFPLVPQFRYRPADRQNTANFHFHWLVFRAWTSDAPMLGFEIKLNDRDLDIRVDLPYLWTGIFIPIFPDSMSHRFWRKSQYYKEILRREQ